MTDYDVAPDGADTNSGAIDAPWRHAPDMTGASSVSYYTTLAAGDRVFFRGGTYQQTGMWHQSDSGTQANPIEFRAFPGETPIITNLRAVTGTWTDEGGNVWSIPLTETGAYLLWVDGVMWASMSSLAGVDADYKFRFESNTLYLGWTRDPSLDFSAFIVTSQDYDYVLRTTNASGLLFNGLTFYGGNTAAVQFYSTSGISADITFEDCIFNYYYCGLLIGGNGPGHDDTGIYIQRANILNCEFDPKYSTYANLSDKESVNSDAIRILDAVKDSTVEGCTITNSGHSAIMVKHTTLTNPTYYAGLDNIQIKNNHITAPLNDYSRAFAISGYASQVTNVKVYGNLFEDTSVRCQAGGGAGCVISGNVFDTVRGTPVYSGDRGEGIKSATYHTGTEQNEIDGLVIANNVFIDIHNDAIRVDTAGSVDIGDITIANNIIYNTGDYDVFAAETSGSITGLSVLNNCLTGTVSYLGTEYSTASAINALAAFSSNITAAPQLGSDYAPQNAALRGVGVFVTGVRARDDLPLSLHPDIGAIQRRVNTFPLISDLDL
jgi:hypothetical protein